MDKISILHIIPHIGSGGCEKQLLELCRRLNKNIFTQSLIWYSNAPDNPEGYFKEAGVNTIFFDKFSMPLWYFFSSLRNSIKEVTPDIIHTWLYSANFWGRWAALSCGAPYLVASYRNEIVKTNYFDSLSEKLLSRKTLKLANSIAVAQSMDTYYGIPRQEIKVIYNAVNLPACDATTARAEIRRYLNLPSDQKIVLMVARQEKQKNYPMFIRAAKNVCLKRSDVTFISVGIDLMLDELKALAGQYGITDNVKFIGLQQDVHRWLAAADVFCFTTNYEGFPNAVLEAMISELPVVSTNFNGVEELITNFQTGILVPLNDDNLMAEEIVKLLDNPYVCKQLGAAAKASVEKKYAWDSLIDQMESLYTNLVRGQSKTGQNATA